VTIGSGRVVRPAFHGLPPKHTAGLRIGLFGGSFNPPHEGHRLASLAALHRLQLDRVWWLVSPGNPLKDPNGLAPIDVRLAAAAAMADHPAVDVTGIEAQIGVRYTLDILRYLLRRCPGVHFVWIMGADNLRNFHRWQGWTEIAATVPIAVIDRPGSTLGVVGTRAAAILERHRLREADATLLATRSPPAFVFLHGPRSTASSTALRERLSHHSRW
jgi:nicotinate-nucleotide adenylyltransferase